MRAASRFKLSLFGGPNDGWTYIDPEVATWPPPLFLYVDGVRGVYVRQRVSVPELEDIDYYHASYVWRYG